MRLVRCGGLIGVLLSSALVAAPRQAATPPDAVVAADGSGQYRTIQDAINAAPQNTRADRRWLIAVKPGVYHELVYVQREKRFVTIVGGDPTRTVITYGLKASDPGLDGLAIGTFRTPTVYIDADDFTAENLTFENSAGPVGQAVAVRVDGDRVVFRNDRFLGWQDTLLLNRGRQYIEDSLITGHVDFIFGGATAFFERCHLHVWRDGYLTAASTPEGARDGFVFSHPQITGEPGAHAYLGRPWRDFAQVAFIDAEMSDVVRPAGWHNWDHPEREKTARYAEFGSTGAGATAAARVSWARALSPQDAGALSASRVLSGSDGWDPARVPMHPSAAKALALPLPQRPGSPASIAAVPASASGLPGVAPLGQGAAPAASPANVVTWADILKQPAAWYASTDAMRIARLVRLYQRGTGGWPKNIDMAKALKVSDEAQVNDDKALTDSTIDNGSTTTQIQFLARESAAAKDDASRAAAIAGIDYLLKAQYANGGWPQYFPLRTDYSTHITFNDDAMINVMTLLHEVSVGRAPYAFVDAAVRAKAEAAVTRGIEVILKTQIVVAGKLTAWCQQHDERTFEPAKARAYEHPSIVSKESVTILRFLMGIDHPDARVVASIEAGVAWLRAVEIHGIRTERRPDPAGPSGFDVVVVPDAAAPPIWARFYQIGTNRPMYSGRDGVIKFQLSEIEIERRAGYSWIGTYAATLLDKDYPAWKARVSTKSSSP